MELRAGYQREYLLGLDHLRKNIQGIETELDGAKHEFYQTNESDDDMYERYLKSINDDLLNCNTKLRKHAVELVRVDSELQLVSLLNKVRELEEVDPEVIGNLTEFWENFKNTVEGIQSITNKFYNNVLVKLKSSCVSKNNVTVDLTYTYEQEIAQFQVEIETILQNTRTLIKSSENRINQDLFTNTNFSERVLVMCDHKAFPILRLIPDLTEKITKACRLSRQWVDRDETYVHDLTKRIRETQTINRKKRADLRDKREKHNAMENDTKDAYQLYKDNQKKLLKLEGELSILEEQIKQFMRAKEIKVDEKRQKESMAGFLEISISQTKKNQTMQLKRSRLLRQLRELEGSLQAIHQELALIQKEVERKSQIKPVIQGEYEESHSSYKGLKSELDIFSQNLAVLQHEVNDLSDYVTQLEIVQNIKTSPENVDDFYDRPVSVKLAPSLREKILRRRNMKNQSKNGSISSRF